MLNAPNQKRYVSLAFSSLGSIYYFDPAQLMGLAVPARRCLDERIDVYVFFLHLLTYAVEGGWNPHLRFPFVVKFNKLMRILSSSSGVSAFVIKPVS